VQEVYNEQKTIRNEFGRIVATVSYLFDRTSRLLERLVCRGKKFIKVTITSNSANKPHREYSYSYHMGKTDYRYSC